MQKLNSYLRLCMYFCVCVIRCTHLHMCLVLWQNYLATTIYLYACRNENIVYKGKNVVFFLFFTSHTSLKVNFTIIFLDAYCLGSVVYQDYLSLTQRPDDYDNDYLIIIPVMLRFRLWGCQLMNDCVPLSAFLARYAH